MKQSVEMTQSIQYVRWSKKIIYYCSLILFFNIIKKLKI